MVTARDIHLAVVKEPRFGLPSSQPALSDEIYRGRLQKVLAAMAKRGLEQLVLYADREHFANFNYLTGFEPRFEEAILVLKKNGDATILLGNECFGMQEYSRIPAGGVLYQALSLPNQPIDRLKDLDDIFRSLGLSSGQKTGVVGWKLMYPYYADKQAFDIPAFIVDALARVTGAEAMENATDLFIHPDYGTRILFTANEIAELEYGAVLASDAMQTLLNNLRTGVTELELFSGVHCAGMPINCYPMLSTGRRTQMGLVSPVDKPIELGDALSCSYGLRGGLTCRSGFVAYSEQDLPQGAKDYVEKLAAPYFATVVNWYEHMKIGADCGEIYDMVQSTFPRETYGWKLNPGHFTALEEWSASPMYPGSTVKLESGMCIQMDIIPSLPGAYAAANCEDGIALADAALREEIKDKYPEMYARMQARRKFMTDVVGIHLPEEVLPMSNTEALYRPYMLNKDLALVVNK